MLSFLASFAVVHWQDWMASDGSVQSCDTNVTLSIEASAKNYDKGLTSQLGALKGSPYSPWIVLGSTAHDPRLSKDNHVCPRNCLPAFPVQNRSDLKPYLTTGIVVNWGYFFSGSGAGSVALFSAHMKNSTWTQGDYYCQIHHNNEQIYWSMLTVILLTT